MPQETDYDVLLPARDHYTRTMHETAHETVHEMVHEPELHKHCMHREPADLALSLTSGYGPRCVISAAPDVMGRYTCS